jgi:hypothetical protein
MYKKVDNDWYTKEMTRYKEYVFGVWTDDEINDPRILRVKRPNGNWSSISPDKKDNWLNRHISHDWFNKDWSSAQIIESDHKYLVDWCFCQGMSEAYSCQPYDPEKRNTKFVVAFNDDLSVFDFILKVWNVTQHN